MKYYPYEEFKNDTNTLLGRVKDFQAEAILAIARGGLTLSHALAEGLNIREVQSIRTELYDNTCKRESITVFDSSEFKNVKRVLVVDDIADSGETLEVIMRHLQEKYSDIVFKSCTLFYKTTSVYEPHFWVNEANDWIDFFWERDFH